jgi:hypothetical protein
MRLREDLCKPAAEAVIDRFAREHFQDEQGRDELAGPTHPRQIRSRPLLLVVRIGRGRLAALGVVLFVFAPHVAKRLELPADLVRQLG